MMELASWIVIGAALVLGLLVGSFLNVVIHRLPRMLARAEVCATDRLEPRPAYNLAWPGSHCPQCLIPLAWWQNLPLISFVWQRGCCRACGARISWRYPLIEALTALCFGFLAWRLNLAPMLLAAMWFSGMLIALAAIDLETGLLPDVLTLCLLWSGLLFNLLGGVTPLDQAVLGAMAGYLVLWCLYWVFRLLTGKEGLGYGDFKLLAALGAWLGWSALPQILLLSSLTGLLTGGILMLTGRMRREDPMPFGPFLACAGWLVWIVVFCF